MSKMTKTQVAHLQSRLTTALTSKADEKFTVIPSVSVTNSEINDKAREFAKILGVEYSLYSYTLQQLAGPVLRKCLPETKAKNQKIQEAKEKYIKLNTIKINEILDEAILGDSTEALKALKAFQDSL